MRYKTAVVTLLSFSLAGAIQAEDHSRPVSVLTQNMDAGTDQTYIVAAVLNPSPSFTVADAVDLTAQELLQASNIPQRTSVLAASIAQKKPDILALEEVSRWEIDLTIPAPTTVVYDQLEFLSLALAKAGAPYRIVAVNNVNDTTLPGNRVASVRFTDRNALLVRADLGPPELHFSDVHTHIFDAVFNFGGLPVSSGWISAEVHTGNRHFRLVATHLTSAIPGVPAATEIQVAQAEELIQSLRNLTVPVLICGDFNSDANGGNFVDATPTAGLIQSAGYHEVWPLTHDASNHGLTWPYYLEDLFRPPPFVAPSTPIERIDLFFEKNMQVVGSDLMLAPTGTTPPDVSDHAGVIAVVRP